MAFDKLDEVTKLTRMNRFILSGLFDELQFLLARRNKKLWSRAAEAMPLELNCLEALLAFIDEALRTNSYKPSDLQKILAKRASYPKNSAVVNSEWVQTLNGIYDQLANHLILNSEGAVVQIELLVTFRPLHLKLWKSLKELLDNKLVSNEEATVQELIATLEQLINLQEISENRTRLKDILNRRWQNIKNTPSCYTQEASVLNGLCVQLAEYLCGTTDKSEVYSLLMPGAGQKYCHHNLKDFEFGEFIFTDDCQSLIPIDGIVERATVATKAASQLDLSCFENGYQKRPLSDNEIKRLQQIHPIFVSVVEKSKAYESAKSKDINFLAEVEALQKALYAGSTSGNGSSSNASGEATAGIARFMECWNGIPIKRRNFIEKLSEKKTSGGCTFADVIARMTTEESDGSLPCVNITQSIIQRILALHKATLIELFPPSEETIRTQAEYQSSLPVNPPSIFPPKKAVPAPIAQPSHDGLMLELYHFVCNQVARLAKKTSPSENEKSKLAHFQCLSLEIWSAYEKMQQLEGGSNNPENQQIVRDMLAQVQAAMFTRTSILPKQSVSGTQWLEFLDSKEVSLNGVLTFAEIAANKKNPTLHITKINPKAPCLQSTARGEAFRDLRFDNPCRMFRGKDTGKLINAGDLTTQLFGSEAGELARCFGTIAHFLLTQLDRVARRNDPKKGADLKYLALRALWMKYYPIAFHFQKNREETQQQDVRDFLAELKVVCAAQINRGFTTPTSAKNWNIFLIDLQNDFPAALLDLDFGKLAIRFKDQEYINNSLTRAGGQSPLISQHFLKHRPKAVRFVDTLEPLVKIQDPFSLRKGNK